MGHLLSNSHPGIALPIRSTHQAGELIVSLRPMASNHLKLLNHPRSEVWPQVVAVLLVLHSWSCNTGLLLCFQSFLSFHHGSISFNVADSAGLRLAVSKLTLHIWWTLSDPRPGMQTPMMYAQFWSPVHCGYRMVSLDELCIVYFWYLFYAIHCCLQLAQNKTLKQPYFCFICSILLSVFFFSNMSYMMYLFAMKPTQTAIIPYHKC